MKAIRVAVVILCGCGVPSDPAAPPDSPDSPDPDEAAITGEIAARPPTIRSVRTDDGFTQIRQNASAALVISGRGLGETTGITVGTLFATVDSVSDREVTATLFSDSATPLGPLDVTLTSTSGSVTAPGAIRLTPFVVSPTAVTGHGTYQSPMSLCDPELSFTGTGSEVDLLPGTHVCGQVITIGAGATVSGHGQQRTILTGTADGGFGIRTDFGDPPTLTTIRALTFAAPLASVSISLDAGSLVLERVTDAGGVAVSSGGSAAIDRYHYDGEGDGLVLAAGTVSHSSIRHCGAGTGIAASADLTVDDVVVEGCAVGISSLGDGATIGNSRLIDNGIGLQVSAGQVTLQSLTIRDDPSTPAPSTTGVLQLGGTVFASNLTISGQRDTGYSIDQHSSDRSAQLFGDGLAIVGGLVGLSIAGIDNNLTLTSSVIRRQTQAALLVSSLDSLITLGQAGQPGDNQLSVVSGVVIEDDRGSTDGFTRYIGLVGTTLNGASFAGQTIDGPAELLPYYRVVSPDSGLQF